MYGSPLYRIFPPLRKSDVDITIIPFGYNISLLPPISIKKLEKKAIKADTLIDFTLSFLMFQIENKGDLT
jgi:hypothetical protein